ncbi:MAG: hypothetical protein JSW61_09785 [Candidatus Thorarchaeota archaeon]|nr:MAG: hypothetical protein JSW61_09785 [Candidatus Thorarchaeota archaeon]
MADGCTIGARRVGPRTFLFKNKDLVYEDFKDHAVFGEDYFAISGVNIQDGEQAGFSIGVNRAGLAACSATVLINNEKPYDVLLETIIREAADLDSAYEIVQTSLEEGHRYQWCNFAVATPLELGVIEIGDGVSDIEVDRDGLARANHHLKLPTTDIVSAASDEEREAGGPLGTSQRRRQDTSRMLRTASTLADIIKILSHHSETMGFDSICRHRDAPSLSSQYLGETAYSYIIEITNLPPADLEIVFHVSRGNPCTVPYKSIPIEFNAPEDEKNRVLLEFP